MGYNRLNRLRHCKIIIDIVNAHYKAGYTTYSGVFRTFVEPFYPMHYNSFMKIINMPNIDRQIETEVARLKKPAINTQTGNPNQIELFKEDKTTV